MTRDAALRALVESLARPHGTGWFVLGDAGSGKSTLLAELRRSLRPGPPAPSASPTVRWALRLLADRTLAVAAVDLGEWAEHAGVTLQGVISAELARQLPRLPFRLSTEFLSRGDLREVLAAAGVDGLVLLCDDLDRFEGDATESSPLLARRPEDLRFLDELAGIVAVYQLPLWIVFTLTEELPGTRAAGGRAGRALRDRYTVLRLSGTRRAKGA